MYGIYKFAVARPYDGSKSRGADHGGEREGSAAVEIFHESCFLGDPQIRRTNPKFVSTRRLVALFTLYGLVTRGFLTIRRARDFRGVWVG